MGVRLALLGSGRSESVVSRGLTAAAVVKLALVVVIVSVRFVSLEKEEGTETSGMAEVEIEFMQSVDVGLVVMVEEVVLVVGGAVQTRVGELVMGASGESGVVMVSLELGGGDVFLVTEETKVTGQVEVADTEKSSLATVTELVETSDGVSDMLVVPTVAMTEITASLQTVRISFGSGKVNLVDRFVDVVGTELSLLGAEIVSEVEMEVIVVNLEVTERLGVMDSEGVEVTETGAGGSVGVAVLVRDAGKIEVGISVVVALASGMEALLSNSVTFVGVAASTVVLTEPMHISESEGVTVLEGEIVTLVESGTESEIVGTVGVVVALGADGAAVGLSLVGVFVSPSCIWASSFSGVLRPDVVGGGPGFITGFGSKAGFPADSCADTLGRI